MSKITEEILCDYHSIIKEADRLKNNLHGYLETIKEKTLTTINLEELEFLATYQIACSQLANVKSNQIILEARSLSNNLFEIMKQRIYAKTSLSLLNECKSKIDD